MKGLVIVAVALVACGGRNHPATPTVPARALTSGDRIVDLLPDGVQVVIEIDVARLRHNDVVGAIVAKALDTGGSKLVTEAPLDGVDEIVLAAYGVGTSNAATVTVLASHKDIAGARRITDGIVALGPPDWVDQIARRAAIGGAHAPAELLQLRDRAMPAGATGAAVRVTARLAFDARVSLARLLGVDGAPAQLSAWGDVADDLAIVIDADAADPGDKNPKSAAARLATTMRRALAAVADDSTVRSLGVLDSLRDAQVKVGGSWVRMIIAIGPEHLRRVVARADALLAGAP
ncbi:MAG TPA: hypothetical protein VGO00_17130 [Kofleriaceae bacterium]|jgi:hypothetical protein|nr:hypothetical protein [Kofleriaceae bacterium]